MSFPVKFFLLLFLGGVFVCCFILCVSVCVGTVRILLHIACGLRMWLFLVTVKREMCVNLRFMVAGVMHPSNM